MKGGRPSAAEGTVLLAPVEAPADTNAVTQGAVSSAHASWASGSPPSAVTLGVWVYQTSSSSCPGPCLPKSPAPSSDLATA